MTLGGSMLRHVLAAVAASATLLTACGSDSGPDSALTPGPSASNAGVSGPPSAPLTTTPSPASSAALERAFVLEVMGARPEMVLARAELVKLGRTTCQAFRDKPGSVATLTKNASAAGQTADQVETIRVVAVAAIHNLCPDQAGDL